MWSVHQTRSTRGKYPCIRPECFPRAKPRSKEGWGAARKQTAWNLSGLSSPGSLPSPCLQQHSGVDLYWIFIVSLFYLYIKSHNPACTSLLFLFLPFLYLWWHYWLYALFPLKHIFYSDYHHFTGLKVLSLSCVCVWWGTTVMVSIRKQRHQSCVIECKYVCKRVNECMCDWVSVCVWVCERKCHVNHN